MKKIYLMLVFLSSLLYNYGENIQTLPHEKTSLRLGFGKELCEGLDTICVSDKKIKGLFANLVSSQPDTKDRIARLQSNGAKYNKKLA